MITKRSENNITEIDSKNPIQEYLEISIKKNLDKANALLSYSNFIDLALDLALEESNMKKNTRDDLRDLFEDWKLKNRHLLKDKLVERLLKENLESAMYDNFFADETNFIFGLIL